MGSMEDGLVGIGTVGIRAYSLSYGPKFLLEEVADVPQLRTTTSGIILLDGIDNLAGKSDYSKKLT